MPRYDQRCRSCAWDAEITVPWDVNPACPICGGDTERVWWKAAHVSGDECDFVTEHGFKTPRRFTSRAEWKRAMKEAGIRPYDKFTPMAGTDKPRVGGITKSLPPMDPEYQAWVASKLASGKAQKEPELPKATVRAEIRELTQAEYDYVRANHV